MSDTEFIKAILQKLNDLGDEVGKMRDTLSHIRAEGCAKAAQHTEVQRDQEMRLREIERWQNEQKGQIIGMSGLISFAMTAAGLLLAWIFSK